jgi:(R,R)-butanediol dehydrogenase/meso-butanediol dehydrogenase/diacetyl reductase
VLVEPNARRRDLAPGLGVQLAVAPGDAASMIAGLTQGRGADVAIECAGNPHAVAAAVALVRRGGTAVVTGVFAADIAIPAMRFVHDEKILVASLAHVRDGDFDVAVGLIEQRAVTVAPLITAQIPLEHAGTHGLRALAEDPANHLKIIVGPNLSHA